MFYLGLDLGKKHDHTAIAIVERDTLRNSRMLLVRHLERVALGTPYTARGGAGAGDRAGPEHARGNARWRWTAREWASRWWMRCGGQGWGARSRRSRSRAESGSRGAGSSCSVPKQDLIAGVQMALEKRELRMARRLEEAGALVKELLDVRVRAGMALGKVRIGADGYGEHDDLVIALALACWRARRRENGFGAGRLPGI